MTALTNYQKETFVWLALGICIIVLRLVTRVKARGIRGLYIDDYLIVLAGVLFAAESALAFTIGRYGTNNVRPEVRESLTAEQVANLEYGSKLLYGGWFVYFSLLWVLKWCMICFYQRLTLGLRSAKFLNYICWLVAITPCAIIVTLLLNCWPVHKNWQVLPDPGVKCTQGWAYFAVTGIPNVISELFLLLIPIPILFQVQISLRKKIPLAILLSLGVFIILATILRHVAIFRDIYDPRQVTIWATREAFTSIFVNCAAQLKPVYDSFYKFAIASTSTFRSRNDTTNNEQTWNNETDAPAMVDVERQVRRESARSESAIPAPSPLVIKTKTSFYITTYPTPVDLERGAGQSYAASDSGASTNLQMYEANINTGR